MTTARASVTASPGRTCPPAWYSGVRGSSLGRSSTLWSRISPTRASGNSELTCPTMSAAVVRSSPSTDNTAPDEQRNSRLKSSSWPGQAVATTAKRAPISWRSLVSLAMSESFRCASSTNTRAGCSSLYASAIRPMSSETTNRPPPSLANASRSAVLPTPGCPTTMASPSALPSQAISRSRPIRLIVHRAPAFSGSAESAGG